MKRFLHCFFFLVNCSYKHDGGQNKFAKQISANNAAANITVQLCNIIQ